MRERKVLVVKTQMCRRTAQQQRVLFSITESRCQPDHQPFQVACDVPGGPAGHVAGASLVVGAGGNVNE